MRGRSALAILLAILLSVPVVGGSTTAMEEEQDEDPCLKDPEQPCVNQTVMYLWSDGNNRHWAHFNGYEAENNPDNQFTNDKDNGVVTIDERFT